MNEVFEILKGIRSGGISAERLAHIRASWMELGKLLDSVQSRDGMARAFALRVRSYRSYRQP